MTGWLTTADAARVLGVTPARVRQLLADDRIPGAHRVGRDWLIPNPPAVVPRTKGPAPRWR